MYGAPLRADLEDRAGRGSDPVAQHGDDVAAADAAEDLGLGAGRLDHPDRERDAVLDDDEVFGANALDGWTGEAGGQVGFERE